MNGRVGGYAVGPTLLNIVVACSTFFAVACAPRRRPQGNVTRELW